MPALPFSLVSSSVASPATWKARGAAVLCLAALAVAAPTVHAQTTVSLTAVGSFNGATGSGPNQALIFGRDGNLYGTAPRGGANEQGTFYRVNSDGLITLIYRFGDNGGSVTPVSPLLQAADGGFYGVAAGAGAGNATRVIYRVNTAGSFTRVHAFATDGSEGTGVVPGLTLGNDGALYGVTQTGGNVTAANTAGDGTIYRVTTDGQFTTLYRFNFNRDGFGGSEPSVPLALGSDGLFYGLTLLGGDFGVGSVYKLATNGQITTIHSFNGKEGDTPVGPLVEGSRGNFYGVTSGGVSGQGAFFRVTSDGTFTVLHAFTADEFSAPQGTASQTQSGLLKAADGNFYLTVQGSSAASDHVLQLTPEGTVSTVFQFGSNAPGSVLAGGLAQASDGSFYGTTVQGGASNDGTVFRLSTGPYPSFFNGSVDLSNGVKYLAFPVNGNIFGYYSFLSDPHYIFHQDLGFEYVFDAADGVGGVYFYDFYSDTFFYTSPTFPFPYLYNFALDSVVYYYPDPRRPGRYNTNEVRYFYVFSLGGIYSF